MILAQSGEPAVQVLLDVLAERLPFTRLSAYDGSRAGSEETAAVHIVINHPRAFLRMIRSPRGLGLARAFVTGEIDIEGDIGMLAANEHLLRDPRVVRVFVASSLRVAARTSPAELRHTGATPAEYRALLPGRHSIRSDLRELDHHYSRTTAFYRNLLGPSLTYSSAMFTGPAGSLEEAQQRKHHRICEKLRLGPDSSVLDIGCGWGSLLGYATSTFGCRGIGITGSREQYRHIVSAPPAAVRVLYGDYRQLMPRPEVDTAVSVGMYEHVGADRSEPFFRLTRKSLPPGARYVNQTIIRREGSRDRFRRNSFVERYIFPNGQLLPLSRQLRDLDRAGFRILSVESFGESYARTIRCWQANLEATWEHSVELEGMERVRAWKLYLAGAAARFESGSIDVVQVLTETR